MLTVHGLMIENAPADIDLNGAIVELRVDGDLFIAEIRIPGPPAP
jgi:hypothetical protein